MLAGRHPHPQCPSFAAKHNDHRPVVVPDPGVHRERGWPAHWNGSGESPATCASAAACVIEIPKRSASRRAARFVRRNSRSRCQSNRSSCLLRGAARLRYLDICSKSSLPGGRGDARCRAFLSGIGFQGRQLVEPSAQVFRQDDCPPSALSRDQLTGLDCLINRGPAGTRNGARFSDAVSKKWIHVVLVFSNALKCAEVSENIGILPGRYR